MTPMQKRLLDQIRDVEVRIERILSQGSLGYVADMDDEEFLICQLRMRLYEISRLEKKGIDLLDSPELVRRGRKE